MSVKSSDGAAFALIFGIGAAFGSFVTWRWLRHSYDEQKEEEVEEVRKYYRGLHEKEHAPEEKPIDIPAEPQKEPVRVVIETVQAKEVTGIEYIHPGEYGEEEDYDKISLTYYADGVLADDLDEVVDDPDDAVGKRFYDHFGEFEPDSVCVKNDRRKAYFEILKDLRYYSDVEKTKPKRVTL